MLRWACRHEGITWSTLLILGVTMYVMFWGKLRVSGRSERLYFLSRRAWHPGAVVGEKTTTIKGKSRHPSQRVLSVANIPGCPGAAIDVEEPRL